MDFQLPERELVEECVLDPRAKTSLRMIYEAQKEVIKRQIGDLEGARATLGLSQRKMAQLLMVDPSAWTRWNRDNEGAPPHIYRALQWYLTIHEKIPGLTPHYFIEKNVTFKAENFEKKINQRLEEHTYSIDQQNGELKNLNLQLELKVKNLEISVKNNRIGAIMLGIATLILGFALTRLLFMQMR